MNRGRTAIPFVLLNTDAILLKADNSPYALTFGSDISGLGYAIGKDRGILILDKHGYLGMRVEDMRVIHQEMEYIIEEAERWRDH